MTPASIVPSRSWLAGGVLLGVALLPRLSGAATDADEAWLRYPAITDADTRRLYADLPGIVVRVGDSPVLRSAEAELVRGFQLLLGRELRPAAAVPADGGALVVGARADLPDGGYRIAVTGTAPRVRVEIAAHDDRGALYGAFGLLRWMAEGEPLAPGLDARRVPRAPLRMVDQWDNLDGTIERGYAGPSIFFEHGAVARDLSRVAAYARLLASVGINGCAINNVNADPRVLAPDFVPQLARVANALRPFGVRLYISVDLASPRTIGGLPTFDPLDARVAAWWGRAADAIYAAIPDFGGFVVKAGSEGRPGPSTYGRTHADAANVMARALRPHGGVVLYRAFIYDNRLDWRDRKADRARAAYDVLQPLDGRFEDGVIIQIKNGPIDFQVREPVSPLFAGLPRTRRALELQVTQEYTGQQRHLCYLARMWREVLDFDMRAGGGHTPVRDLVSAMVAVTNVGRDPYWLGHPLAMANLFAFGRLAFDPEADPARLAQDWARLTFGGDAQVISTLRKMLLASWTIYESYTGPLGLGTLTDIIHAHYGPAPGSSEENGWGQWLRADADGVGMDRTVATGTGFIGQYPPAVAARYESLRTCPDELLLFMHHVPYTHVLHSGKTVIQHIYDAHADGAAHAQGLLSDWQAIGNLIDSPRYLAVLRRLEYQAGHARVWRDAVNGWFLRRSGIPDHAGRVGVAPEGRVEAEAMALTGYAAVDVTPVEAASGGRAVACAPGRTRCAASFRYAGPGGSRPIEVGYFDQRGGAARFRLLVDGRVEASWTADDDPPSDHLDGHTAARRKLEQVRVLPGNEVRVEVEPDGGDRGGLDFVDVAAVPQHFDDLLGGALTHPPR